VNDAPAPGVSTCCSGCGTELPPAPRGVETGLVVREVDEKGEACLVLPFPRPNGAATTAFGAVWLACVGSAAWVLASNGGGLVWGLLAILAAMGVSLMAQGVRGLTATVRVSLGATDLRVSEGGLGTRREDLRVESRDVLGFSVERDDLVRYVVSVLTRDGRALRLPYAFERKSHAVWVAERLQSLLDERRAALPYR
jgi:hypothetical protein